MQGWWCVRALVLHTTHVLYIYIDSRKHLLYYTIYLQFSNFHAPLTPLAAFPPPISTARDSAPVQYTSTPLIKLHALCTLCTPPLISHRPLNRWLYTCLMHHRRTHRTLHQNPNFPTRLHHPAHRAREIHAIRLSRGGELLPPHFRRIPVPPFPPALLLLPIRLDE